MSTAPTAGFSTDTELTTGWGRGSTSAARMRRIHSQEDLIRVVNDASRAQTQILARGLGRSYGDAAQCQGGTLLDTQALDRIIDVDFDSGRIRVEAGLSIDRMLRVVIPRGWFIPVTPGTRQVTIGGAIAADVHGKNHHRDGAIGAHVRKLTLVNVNGCIELSPEDHSDLFWATIGGMGLTGVIAEATLQLSPIETALMTVDTDRTKDLDETMASLTAEDDRYRYSVAWVDGAARRGHLGRSVLMRGDHARSEQVRSRRRHQALDYQPKRTMNVPGSPPVNLVLPAAITAGNELYYRRGSKHRVGELQSIASFFYPLDAIGNWNLLYGPRGFTQYQFVVPFGAEITVRKVFEHLHNARVTPTLVVLKRFGAADPAPLSFPMPGWTLAIDLPLGNARVGTVLDELDGLIAESGGRVYLAKDGRLRPELFREMYPLFGQWNATRREIDPGEIFASDLSRRLGVH